MNKEFTPERGAKILDDVRIEALRMIETTSPVTAEVIAMAHVAGFIPKKDLKDGIKYIGHCRNNHEAIWHAHKGCFTYLRTKWGSSYYEDIYHFEDDDGYDVFIPFEEAK